MDVGEPQFLADGVLVRGAHLGDGLVHAHGGMASLVALHAAGLAAQTGDLDARRHDHAVHYEGRLFTRRYFTTFGYACQEHLNILHQTWNGHCRGVDIVEAEGKSGGRLSKRDQYISLPFWSRELKEKGSESGATRSPLFYYREVRARFQAGSCWTCPRLPVPRCPPDLPRLDGNTIGLFYSPFTSPDSNAAIDALITSKANDGLWTPSLPSP